MATKEMPLEEKYDKLYDFLALYYAASYAFNKEQGTVDKWPDQEESVAEITLFTSDDVKEITVEELITSLKKIPLNCKVFIESDEYGPSTLCWIKYNPELKTVYIY